MPEIEESEMRWQQECEWAKTDLGSAFVRFEAALSVAWAANANPHQSDHRVLELWNKVRDARADFLKFVRGW